MSNEVEYNGYVFNDYSHVTVKAMMVEDEAARTVLYHDYTVRVETTIYAEAGEQFAGDNFRRMRQLLTKQGRTLRINHAGFGPLLTINSGSGGVRDVNFGPKPRILEWQPVGATNAVEVIWECQFSIPVCEGDGSARFTGISSLNYGIGYRIDRMGYTTRTVTGFLEIAMTRMGQQIPDTADAYRDFLIIAAPNNFERETHWNLSPDKRRLDFSIVDSQIRSANRYPAGVIDIRASHRVGWSRRHMSSLPSTISASITLVPGLSRGIAWEIFRNLVYDRLQYATSDLRTYTFMESLEVDEDLYGEGTINFRLGYRVAFVSNPTGGPETGGALSAIFSTTGIFQPTPGDWAAWKLEVAKVQKYRGMADLRHNASEDQIIDLCTNNTLPSTPTPESYPNYPSTPYSRLCNKKPPPDRSYIRFDGVVSTIEDNPSVAQITIGRDDLSRSDFDPNEPTAGNGQTDANANIVRILESAAPGMEFEWRGYAERVGYDIPRPDKIKFGDIVLVRVGRGEFRKRRIGIFFCQPVYAAGWVYRYRVDTRPQLVAAGEADPVNGTPT